MTATDDAIEVAHTKNSAYREHTGFGLGVAQIIRAAITSGYLVPADDPGLVELRAIVKDLAAHMPEVARDCYYVCGCCREESTSNITHAVSCVWRRAQEWNQQ